MMEVTTEDKTMVVTDKDGLEHKVQAKVITTRDGFDEQGNPKVSVQINVPPIEIGAQPGKVE